MYGRWLPLNEIPGSFGRSAADSRVLAVVAFSEPLQVLFVGAEVNFRAFSEEQCARWMNLLLEEAPGAAMQL